MKIETKKEYSTPTLTTHGDVQSLTQTPALPDGSGPIMLPTPH